MNFAHPHPKNINFYETICNSRNTIFFTLFISLFLANSLYGSNTPQSLVTNMFVLCDHGDKEEVLRFIKEHNYDVNMRSQKGFRALDIVITSCAQKCSLDSNWFNYSKKSYLLIAKLLLDCGTKINADATDPVLPSFLTKAVYLHQPDFVQFLMEYGANPQYRQASQRSTLEFLQGCDQFSDEQKCTYFYLMNVESPILKIINKKIPKIGDFLKLHPDIQFLFQCFVDEKSLHSDYLPQNCPRETIFGVGNYLHIATKLEKGALTKLLLDRHESYRAALHCTQSPLNRTPLHNAVLAKNPELVKLLVEHGADGSIKDIFGNTPAEMLFTYKPAAKIPLKTKHVLLSALGMQRIITDEIAF